MAFPFPDSGFPDSRDSDTWLMWRDFIHGGELTLWQLHLLPLLLLLLLLPLMLLLLLMLLDSCVIVVVSLGNVCQTSVRANRTAKGRRRVRDHLRIFVFVRKFVRKDAVRTLDRVARPNIIN